MSIFTRVRGMKDHFQNLAINWSPLKSKNYIRRDFGAKQACEFLQVLGLFPIVSTVW